MRAFILALLLSGLAPQAAPGGMAVWDTGESSADALTPAAIAAKLGWTAVPGSAESFKGDAVVSNGKILAVFRRKAGAVDLYSLGAETATARARLVLQDSTGRPVAHDSPAVADRNRTAAIVAFGGRAATARFRLGRGEPSIEAQPGAGAGRLRVECTGRFAVLPDFFADDILIDAAKIPGASAEIPSENLLLQPTGSGDAIVMTSFENREQDVRLSLSGEGADRRIVASEIEFGASKKIWVAVMAEPRIWHAVEVKPGDANKEIPLDWRMPFPASWRVDYTRQDGLSESWDMLLQHKTGQEYVKPAPFGGPPDRVNDATRRRFTEVLGFFPYPAWSDPERKGYLQPLELATRTKFVPVLKHVGPAVLFPLGRVPETPVDAFTVVDVMRITLGQGPCQNILDLEGQKEEYKGIATCNARDKIAEIYKKGEQKQRHAEILKALDDTLAFVKHIRARIAAYQEFGRGVRAYLAAQKKAHPELAAGIDQLDRIAGEIDARVEERAERIKSPADVAAMNEEFRKNVVDSASPDPDRVKAFGEALTRVGGNQDKLVSECRWVARTLRSQSALLMASDPRLAPVAAEIRARSQEVLKKPSHHERARQ